MRPAPRSHSPGPLMKTRGWHTSIDDCTVLMLHPCACVCTNPNRRYAPCCPRYLHNLFSSLATHSLTHSLTHSPTYSLTHSLTHQVLPRAPRRRRLQRPQRPAAQRHQRGLRRAAPLPPAPAPGLLRARQRGLHLPGQQVGMGRFEFEFEFLNCGTDPILHGLCGRPAAWNTHPHTPACPRSHSCAVVVND